MTLSADSNADTLSASVLLENSYPDVSTLLYHLFVPRVEMTVSVPRGNLPQVLAAAEISSGTADTLGCSVRLYFYV